MVIIVLVVIAIIVLIVLKRSKSSGSDFGAANSEIDIVHNELITEINKPEPNYDRIKRLKEWENRLRQQASGGVVVGQQVSEVVGGNYFGSAPANNTLSSESSVQITGLDVALYAGSLLILAGVGGLVWSGLSTLGLILLVIATILFYGGGMLMRNNETFKRVSQVLVGTGMAMLPFVGILFYNITKVSPEVIWLVMSLIGVPVYIFATYVMNNRIFSYFAMVGLVSFSCSISSVLGLSMVWYFAFIMILGIILNLISRTNVSTRLGVMFEAVRITGEWLPIAALMASVFAGGLMTEVDFAILLSVIILQCALNLWQKPNLLWENVLRLALSILIVLFAHIVMPTSMAIGVGIIVAASLELIYSITMMIIIKKAMAWDVNRIALEIMWVIGAMVCYCIACLFLADFRMAGEFWVSLLIALIADIGIIAVAVFCFDSSDWLFGLPSIGIALPLVIANAANMPFEDSSYFFMVFYIVEMALLTWMSWLFKDDNRGDLVAIISIFVYGAASVIASPNTLLDAFVLVLVAALLVVRGYMKKQKVFCELAVYTFTLAIMDMINYSVKDIVVDSTMVINMAVIMTHIAFVSLVTTSLIWDDRTKRTRLKTACIGLLVLIGLMALSGQTWIMLLFIAEAAGVLIYGLISKTQMFWVVGAIAIFLAVLWFTKDLYFVWPVILGVGLIGSVVGIILYNDRMKKK